VSTATDLVRLGEAAESDPVLAGIVAMPSVTLPVAGTVYNYDYELGHHGFVGIKTGSDGQAGGCFLFDAAVPVGSGAARTGGSAAGTPGGGTVHVIGAVLGQQATPIITSALDAAVGLVGSLGPQLAVRTVVAAGQRFGSLRTPWGASAPVVAASGVSAVAVAGMRLRGTVTAMHLGSSVRRGQRVGTLTLTVGGTTHLVPLVAGAALGGPGVAWRLTNL
jgi:D-alanyl-D-alanine carboxypeptidase (penicillin-binding protein 5/6)